MVGSKAKQHANCSRALDRKIKWEFRIRRSVSIMIHVRAGLAEYLCFSGKPQMAASNRGVLLTLSGRASTSAP